MKEKTHATPPLLTIDEKRREVFVRGRRVHLAPKEFRILSALKKSDRVLSREDLAAEVWDPADASELGPRVIDQHVSRLRRKIKADVVETVFDLGYRIAAGV